MPKITRFELRGLIEKTLRTDPDLRAFLTDHFPSVSRRIGAGMDRVALVNMLFELIDEDEILAALEQRAPDQIRVSDTASATTQFTAGQRGEPQPELRGKKDGQVSVACFYSPKDTAYFKELRTHAAPLVRREVISLWSPDDIPGGLNAEEAAVEAANEAEIILLLVTPDWVSEGLYAPWFNAAHERWRRGQAQIIPILTRPTRIENTILANLQMLPRGGKAISQARNTDEVWVEVLREIDTALKYRTKRVQAPESTSTNTSPWPPTAMPPHLGIQQIFVLSGFPEHTFIEPVQLSEIIPQLSHMGMGLIIEGPSGIGKSTMVWRALKDIGVKNPLAQWFRSTDLISMAQLSALLVQGFTGHLVIDDFHYMDASMVKMVADSLQATATVFPTATAKMIFIGVEQVGRRLLQARNNLGNKLFSVSVARQPPEKLAEMITLGENKANIEFQHRAEMIHLAGGSFSVLQLICYKMATKNGVQQTQRVKKVITDSPSVVLQDIMAQYEGEFEDPLQQLVKYDDVSPPRGAGLALLWMLARSASDVISLDDARAQFPALRLAFDWLQGARLTQFMAGSKQLSPWLHYDGNKTLSIQDPRLGFYLRQLKWSLFIDRIGPIGMRLSGEGIVEVTLGIQSTAPRANERETQQATTQASAPVQATPIVASARVPTFPANLIDALRRGKLIPFIGAGVSRAIRKAGAQEALFPTWSELLAQAAKRVEQEGDGRSARTILSLLDGGNYEDFLFAAKKARAGLAGGLWVKFLAEHLDPKENAAAPASLALPQALWQLGSKLVVTTNYDRVLEWACRLELGEEAKVANIAAPDQLGAILGGSVDRPTVWHLHGSILDLTTLILTPDGYHRLYPEGNDRESEYQAALLTLSSLLAGQTLLFVGFSFTDQPISDRIKSINDIFKGNAGPHYVLVRASELELMRTRLSHLPLQFVPFEAYGDPLVQTLQQLAMHRPTS